jgi:hypothetical protein
MAGRRRPRLGLTNDGTYRPLDRLVEAAPSVGEAPATPADAMGGEADLAALEARRAKWSLERARVERARRERADASGPG